jgi:hypothetical protein
MADQQQLADILHRFDAGMQALNQQAMATEARFALGEANLQTMVTALETRLLETENRLTTALTTVASSMTALQAAVDVRQAASEAHMSAAMHQLISTLAATAAPPAAASIPVPSSPRLASATPGSSTAPPPPVFDPWANASLPPQAAGGFGGGPGQAQFPATGPDAIKSKDFSHIDVFNGDLSRFADWIDRMGSKLSRAHPSLAGMLTWAEKHPDQITLADEQNATAAAPSLDVVSFSGAVYDVLMERTGAKMFDKRRNAGAGRGFEFWRILKRDFGMASSEAHAARLAMYMQPAKCASMALLGDALDKWEALGGDLNRPMDDDFKMLALKVLVPKNICDMITSQMSLRTFPEALAYVRRQVADHRHANQAQAVQRAAHQGPAPMDVSALNAAYEWLHGGSPEDAPLAPTSWPQESESLETLIAALKGKGKGKGKESKGKGKGEDRDCYNCGVKGHLSRDCPAPQKSKGDGKGAKGKGKAWGVHHLSEERDDGISLGCLMLNAVSTTQPEEVWNDYEMVEAVIDSGAGECVCGPQHFPGIDMKVDPARASAAVEYICADGARIPNMGEKLIPGLSDEGSRLSINFQVTQVDRPLLAVSKLTAAGHEVWFGDEQGVITHGSTGKQTHFQKRNGVYVLRIWVPRVQPMTSGGSRQ